MRNRTGVSTWKALDGPLLLLNYTGSPLQKQSLSSLLRYFGLEASRYNRRVARISHFLG